MSENTRTVVEEARKEADDVYPEKVYEIEHPAFIEGATFAATITPEQVEAAARAIHAQGGTTEDMRPETCRTCRRAFETARAAFTAAGFQIEADR